MSWKKEEKKEEKKEFTKDEIISFRKGIEHFSQIKRTFIWPGDRIHDQYITRLEQYMESLGVIKFDDLGRKICRDPEGYDRLNALNEIIERRDYALQMADEERMPELKEKRLQKVTEMGKQLRGFHEKFKV